MLVRDLMSPTVVTVTETDSVADAAKLMHRHNIGALPVVSEEGVLRGIVTDRDIVVRSVASGKDTGSEKVAAAMTPQLIVVSPDMTAEALSRLMAEHQVRRLPVVTDGVLSGIVTLCDLARNVRKAEAAAALTEISMP